MPKYSTYVPDLVYPDTSEGREEARRHYGHGIVVGFCSDYKKEGRLCQNREWRESRDNRVHSWCFRCPAGYMVAMAEGMDPLREEQWSTEQRNVKPLW